MHSWHAFQVDQRDLQAGSCSHRFGVDTLCELVAVSVGIGPMTMNFWDLVIVTKVWYFILFGLDRSCWTTICR